MVARPLLVGNGASLRVLRPRPPPTSLHIAVSNPLYSKFILPHPAAPSCRLAHPARPRAVGVARQRLGLPAQLHHVLRQVPKGAGGRSAGAGPAGLGST